MSVFINNGLSGLLAAQRALQTTSNNVANAMTDGYVRQRVEFGERPGNSTGRYSIGNGVSVNAVRRVYDQFLAEEVKSASMSQSRAQSMSDLTSRLDSLLGNPDKGIGQSLQAFFAQVEAVNRDPTSSVNRKQLLAQGEALGQQFAQLDTQINRLGDEVDGRLRESVNQINQLAGSLAQLNGEIAARANNIPNDLLDQQELLLNKLSGLVDFTTIRQGNGTVNVLVGTGQALVLDVNSFQLGLVQNEFDGSRLELGYQGQPISGMVSGGSVAGLLSFRNEALDSARRDLGQMALGVTEIFNAQHRQGMDLNGNLGQDFFRGIAPTVSASAKNTGSAAVNLSIADPAGTQAKDYILRYTGSAWQLMDAETGGPVTMTGSGTGADPFIVDGLAITAGAGAASGDRFLLSAVRNATTGVQVSLTDPNRIAAASPLTTGAGLQNLSSAAVSAASVADITNPALLQGAQIVFDNPTTYRVLSSSGTLISGPNGYTDGADISANGWTVQVTGSPAAGDRFNILSTGAGSGDNSNALVLSEIGAKGYFNNGQISLSNLSSNLVADVGSTAARASADLTVQTALREQADLDLEAVSGVNLEEEAVNMMRYQEAYLAASKIISVANDLFNSLLGAMGR